MSHRFSNILEGTSTPRAQDKVLQWAMSSSEPDDIGEPVIVWDDGEQPARPEQFSYGPDRHTPYRNFSYDEGDEMEKLARSEVSYPQFQPGQDSNRNSMLKKKNGKDLGHGSTGWQPSREPSRSRLRDERPRSVAPSDGTWAPRSSSPIVIEYKAPTTLGDPDVHDVRSLAPTDVGIRRDIDMPTPAPEPRVLSPLSGRARVAGEVLPSRKMHGVPSGEKTPSQAYRSPLAKPTSRLSRAASPTMGADDILKKYMSDPPGPFFQPASRAASVRAPGTPKVPGKTPKAEPVVALPPPSPRAPSVRLPSPPPVAAPPVLVPLEKEEPAAAGAKSKKKKKKATAAAVKEEKQVAKAPTPPPVVPVVASPPPLAPPIMQYAAPHYERTQYEPQKSPQLVSKLSLQKVEKDKNRESIPVFDTKSIRHQVHSPNPSPRGSVVQVLEAAPGDEHVQRHVHEVTLDPEPEPEPIYEEANVIRHETFLQETGGDVANHMQETFQVVDTNGVPIPDIELVRDIDSIRTIRSEEELTPKAHVMDIEIHPPSEGGKMGSQLLVDPYDDERSTMRNFKPPTEDNGGGTEPRAPSERAPSTIRGPPAPHSHMHHHHNHYRAPAHHQTPSQHAPSLPDDEEFSQRMEAIPERELIDMLKTPRTGYAASQFTLGADTEADGLNPRAAAALNMYHDEDLCILLQAVDDELQHPVVRKAVKKAIEMRLRKLGMGGDYDAVRRDPKLKAELHGHAFGIPTGDEAPEWARKLSSDINELLMRLRIEQRGDDPRRGKHRYRPEDTLTVDRTEDADSLHPGHAVDEGGLAYRPDTDVDRPREGTYGDIVRKPPGDSPGGAIYEEEIYKLKKKRAMAAPSGDIWEIEEDPNRSGEHEMPDSEYNNERRVGRANETALSPRGVSDSGADPSQWLTRLGLDPNEQPPWLKIYQLLLNWTIVWPFSELDNALKSTERGEQVDEIALSIYTTQVYKRFVRNELTQFPPRRGSGGLVDKMFIPPNMADAINNAVYNGRHADAAAMLKDMWYPFGFHNTPRVILVLARHRREENHWVVHKFSLSDGQILTFDCYSERSLPDSRPLGWWFAIRMAFPNERYPAPEGIAQRVMKINRPLQLLVDNSVGAAAIWRNLLMGNKAERLVDLERLRDLISQEVKSLRQRKEMGKLSLPKNAE